MPVKIFLSSYANKPYHISDFGKILFGVNPDGELWFLYVLFVITIAVSLIAKNTIGKKGLVISFLIFVLGIINPFEIHLNAWLSLYEQFYFCIGVYVNNRMADSNIREVPLPNNLFALGLILFFVCNLLRLGHYNYGNIPTVITSFTGIYCIWWLSRKIANIDGWIKKWTKVIGEYCMDVYILSPILYLPFRMIIWSKLNAYYTAFVVCTIIGVIMPYIVSKYIIRKNRYLSLGILGLSHK